ncbi:MAG: sigma-54 dependent transcriptional regulator [Mucinivorans sp.]
MPKILIVDDQRAIRTTLKELLEIEGYQVEMAADGPEALELMVAGNFSLVISDVKMPLMDGHELLKKLLEMQPEISVVMISGHGNIETAVECIRNGAFDFVTKPIEMNRFLLTVRNALIYKEQIKEIKKLKAKTSNVVEMVGQSAALEKVRETIEKVALTDARVLILGSNGTGKELVARQLHQKSHRSGAPFIEVNCAAIPSELIESELFGHEKGAFTSAIKQRKGKFEQAEGGTIFLDEIGDMSLAAQAKVLRALQERKICRVGSDTDININVRVMAATNKDLQAEIAAGRFREDLYHRLSVILIQVPSLAERTGDIELLTHFFLEQVCQEQGVAVKQISPEALAMLEKMPWRGNIRELRNVVERLVILGGQTIEPIDIKNYM